MTGDIEDLAPFFADRCWMFVLLAREASVAVILRRGPTKWWHVTLWDTRTDKFQSGQWFHGQMYPGRCDVSPDGKLFIYFAGKFRRRDVAKTWTAVSRPPYLTALALWPIGHTWGGHGVFVDNRTVRVATSAGSFGAVHHPDHPPGPLSVLEYSSVEYVPCWQSGWSRILEPGPTARYFAWRKKSEDLTLERNASYPSSSRSLYAVYRGDSETGATFEAHWADWDQQGRLVAAVGGRILGGKLTKKHGLRWRQLAAMNEDHPVRMEAPEWAKHW